MEYESNFRRKSFCANCGKQGHEYRHCHEPITSYGIINICIYNDTNESAILKSKFHQNKKTCYKVVSTKYPNIHCYISDNIGSNDENSVYKLDNDSVAYQNEDQMHKFCYYKDKIMFMMVSRRFSLGFVEFVRGKYNIFDSRSIINLFQQMYDDEIKFIRKNNYDNLLYHFLNRKDEPKEIVLNRVYEGKYSNEYCEAKIKFNILSNPSEDENNDIYLDLNFYTRYIEPKWKKPEWGFPKGRRDKCSEGDLTCACREFEEETGYRKNEYEVLNKIKPIEEHLMGTNGVNYKHIYYLAIDNNNHNTSSEYDFYEIGDIKWFTFDEAISNIRPYHTEKKKILTRIYLFLLNYLINNTI